MSKANLLVILSLLVLALTGCDTAVSRAKAERIHVEAEATRVATEHAQAVNADREAMLEATRADRVWLKQNLIWWALVLAVSTVAVTWCGYAYVVMASARALAYRMMLNSQAIRIDEATRTWPVLLTPGGRLVDFETGEARLLSDAMPVDYRRLAISARVREVGLLASAARDIAKATRAGQVDALGLIAGNVPVLEMDD